jgi:selenide, water dikinase
MVPYEDAAVLVDASTGDDAAVYQITEDRALVATTDFFTPIVDDPYDFGRIAAANALSDIYAMGARPLFALNLVAFPRELLDQNILSEILRGGSEIALEAGIAIIGGHSIDDKEPKYGLCVIGEIDPRLVMRNTGAQPGDLLVLTKPIGTGVISTALKKDQAPSDVVAAAVRSMTTLNRPAAESMLRVGASAATDVTGFGLLGHLASMLRASGVAARVRAGLVPFLPGARDLAEAGHIAGGTRRNMEDAESITRWTADVSPAEHALLCDAQTSGGLLISIAANRADQLLDALREANTPAAAIIGDVRAGDPHVDVVQ